MKNDKIIAQALLEIARTSKTEFLEGKKIDKEIIEAADKIGIVLPSEDLMVMRTTYCKIGKKNLNNVILFREDVEKSINTLVGKQCNWEHDSHQVCGYTISAKIKDDRVETINVIFKSLFQDKAEELKEKVKSGAAAVSFEIYNKIDGKSVIKELEDGTKIISPILFHGTGILLVNKPAEPSAKIFKLIAKKEIDEAEKITNRIFNEDLIYASSALENTEEASYECECLKCGKIVTSEKHCKDIKCPACGGDMRRKDRPGTGQPTEKSEEKEDNKVELEDKKVELENSSEETKAEVKPEETQIQDAPKVDAQAEQKPEENPAVAETKPEIKAEETKEENAQAPLETIVPKVVVKVTRIYSDVYVDTYVDGTQSGTSEGKSYVKTVTEYADGTKDEVESESEYKKKFDYAEVEAKVNEAKAEAQKTIDAKDLEIKNLNETKDKEISNLKQELDAKAQEIATLKVEKAEVDEPASLIVGNVETLDNDETKQRANDIDKIIASKHQNK